MNDLYNELEKASKSNPDLNVIEVIELVTDLKYPSRCKEGFLKESFKGHEKWNLSNSDILSALKSYNKNRGY